MSSSAKELVYRVNLSYDTMGFKELNGVDALITFYRVVHSLDRDADMDDWLNGVETLRTTFVINYSNQSIVDKKIRRIKETMKGNKLMRTKYRLVSEPFHFVRERFKLKKKDDDGNDMFLIVEVED